MRSMSIAWNTGSINSLERNYSGDYKSHYTYESSNIPFNKGFEFLLGDFGDNYLFRQGFYGIIPQNLPSTRYKWSNGEITKTQEYSYIQDTEGYVTKKQSGSVIYTYTWEEGDTYSNIEQIEYIEDDNCICISSSLCGLKPGRYRISGKSITVK